MSMSTVSELLAARVLAQVLHYGQVDKAGRPYIEHVERVTAAVGLDAAPAACLHDLVEDTHVTLDGLAAGGFCTATLAAVDALTRRDGESYRDYIDRLATNAIARAVKLADLRDNLDPRRVEAARAGGHDTTALEQRYNDAVLRLLAREERAA